MYSILGDINLNKNIFFERVITTVEDYIWLKLTHLNHPENLATRDVLFKYQLWIKNSQLLDIVESYGVDYFTADGSRPFSYFRVKII